MLPCRAELSLIRALAREIEQQRQAAGTEKSILIFEDPSRSKCSRCAAEKGSTAHPLSRIVTLFTVCQGEHTVVLVDYKCSACGCINVYTGKYHGIVPARKHTAYTVELMYYCVVTSCLLSV